MALDLAEIEVLPPIAPLSTGHRPAPCPAETC
jgi:hypothetical protein